MKRILILLLVFLQACDIMAQHTRLMNDPTPMVRRMMEIYHCCPPDRNTINKRILDNLLRKLDQNRIFFTKADADTILHAGPLLEKELSGKNSDFLNLIMAMYKNRVARTDSIVSSIMRKPLDFKAKESAILNDTFYADNSVALIKKLTAHLKFSCLYQLANIAAADSTASSATILKQEPQIREKVLRSVQRRIRRIVSHPADYEAMMIEQLSDAICKSYDPHSDFFTKTAREDFVGAVTGEAYQYGFSFDDNEKDEVCLTHLTPGSPAWKSGELNKGDVITAMRWEGIPTTDVTGDDAEEVDHLLGTQKDNKIELTVRKADGTIKVVKMQKAKIQDEENFVRSYVLDGDVRIGYIVLPGFYSEWESKNGKNCADDVAREVVKLKNENVQGIILDLRYNGGGSMTEAMALAGIFINEGILAFAKDNTNKASGFRDPNRGTIYDGPLTVMINRASASASEMVAGALQDYNRAIIVGSPTFGKATMQIVLPLDTGITQENATEARLKAGNEFVKVSNGKFYRVKGSTHQLTGVQPDIHLPDVTESADYGEFYLHYPLAPDSVKRAIYFTPLPALPTHDLALKSNERVKANAAFRMVDSASSYIIAQRIISDQPMTMQLDEYIAMMKKYKKDTKRLEAKMEGATKAGAYHTRHMEADAQRVKVDYDNADDLKKALENIDKDIYIQECFFIITDYLKTSKK